jgi:beta-lactamase regulating signal transducer with metallopeptidase domain
MNIPIEMIICAGAMGFAVPWPLRRSTWPHRAPVAAITLWLSLSASFAVAVALAAYEWVAPTPHLHTYLAELLHICGVAPHHGAPRAHRPALVLPTGEAVLLVGAFAFHLLRSRRFRTQHIRILDMVGHPSPGRLMTVLDHATPAVYCVPGRGPRIVVSEGALRLLNSRQLDAVLAHERAHIAGRHHVITAATRAFRSVFRPVPLTRHAATQVGILLEMLADDRALRRHSQDALVTAIYELAASQVPRGTFSAGSPSALPRLQRVLAGHTTAHPVLNGCVVAAAAVMPLVPFLVICRT